MLPTPGLTGGLAALLLPGVSLAGGEIIAGSGLPGIGLGRLLSTPGRSGGADRSLLWRCAPRGLPLRRVLALWLRIRRPLRLLGLPLRWDLPGGSLTWIVAGGCGLTVALVVWRGVRGCWPLGVAGVRRGFSGVAGSSSGERAAACAGAGFAEAGVAGFGGSARRRWPFWAAR